MQSYRLIDRPSRRNSGDAYREIAQKLCVASCEWGDGTVPMQRRRETAQKLCVASCEWGDGTVLMQRRRETVQKLCVASCESLEAATKNGTIYGAA